MQKLGRFLTLKKEENRTKQAVFSAKAKPLICIEKNVINT